MNLGDSHEWVLRMAQDAIGKPKQAEASSPISAPEPNKPKPRKRRKRHWSQSFQIKFCRWVKGKEAQPTNLGYSRCQLRKHLERQFTKKMSWNNYAGNQQFKSSNVWVIDHIVPKSTFAENDVASAYALTNLRPLWIQDNMAKGISRTYLI